MNRGIAPVPDRDIEVDDEPTVVAPLADAWNEVAEPDDPTVMASGDAISGEVIAPRGREDELRRLFAEPPRLEREGAPPKAATGTAPNRRRRKLLLLFVLMAGTWIMVRPPPRAAGPVSRLRSVTPAALPSPPTPVVRVAPADHATPSEAAQHLAAGRYDAALAQYLRLADADAGAGGGAYPIIVEILTREVVAQCREQASPLCEWR